MNAVYVYLNVSVLACMRACMCAHFVGLLLQVAECLQSGLAVWEMFRKFRLHLVYILLPSHRYDFIFVLPGPGTMDLQNISTLCHFTCQDHLP